MTHSGHPDLDRVFREEHGRVVATLVRHFGDIDVAEEAAQEAYLVALQRWPESGLPPNPGGWLTTTARNRAIDRIRRESTRDSRHAQAAMLNDVGENADDHPVSSVADDRLRLMFTCCHPALATSAQVGLTLRLLGGLTVVEVANAFLVDEAAMAKRLTRSKQKIKAARIPYRVPSDAPAARAPAGSARDALPHLQRGLSPVGSNVGAASVVGVGCEVGAGSEVRAGSPPGIDITK